MTSKSLSISTENPTHILRCKIVLPLRFAICTLIFSTCILWVQNNAFAQEPLQFKTVSGLYDNTDYITNLKPDQAILITSSYPAGPLQDIQVVSYIDIVNGRYDFRKYRNSGLLGRYFNDSDTSIRYYASLIDAKYFYSASTPTQSLNLYLSRVNAELDKIGLSTINSRAVRISLLNSSFIVSPYDFRSYIQPWVVVGLVIAILIPAWYLCRRFLRG